MVSCDALTVHSWRAHRTLCCCDRYALLFWTPLILYHILGAASKRKYVAEAGETVTDEQIEIGRDSVSEVRGVWAHAFCLETASEPDVRGLVNTSIEVRLVAVLNDKQNAAAE